MQLNIDSSAAIAFTNQLEKLHRSALPVAIRGTLNKAAFNVKQVTMPRSAERTFIKRQPNFFKANSRVEMAQGFDIRAMRAVVGFTSIGLRGGHNYSVRELEQQEYGGDIEKRTFIPLDAARVGGSHTKLVRTPNRLSEIEGIVNSNTINGNSEKAKFIRAAFKAGRGGFVIGNLGKKKLYRVDEATREGGKMSVRTKALYSFQLGRSVAIKGTGFMQTASMESANRMYEFYAQEAARQIARLKSSSGFQSGFGNKRQARGSLGRITKKFF